MIEINSKINPPICKIFNFSKYLYEKNKKEKKKNKKSKLKNIKEIKIRPNTNENDYQIKKKKIIKFLNIGNKVKITLKFRGREIIHKNIAINMLNRIKDDLKLISIVEFFSKRIENRQIIMILIGKKIK